MRISIQNIHSFNILYASCTQRSQKSPRRYRRLTRRTISVILNLIKTGSCALAWEPIFFGWPFFWEGAAGALFPRGEGSGCNVQVHPQVLAPSASLFADAIAQSGRTTETFGSMYYLPMIHGFFCPFAACPRGGALAADWIDEVWVLGRNRQSSSWLLEGAAAGAGLLSVRLCCPWRRLLRTHRFGDQKSGDSLGFFKRQRSGGAKGCLGQRPLGRRQVQKEGSFCCRVISATPACLCCQKHREPTGERLRGIV